MPKHPVNEKLFIDGPVGRLEAALDRPGEGPLRGCAVVCHPHPQHGGTMHNKVAHTLARAFVRSGHEVLRFNFRGTEKSAGHYDNGVGELDDALAAIEFMRARHASYPLWLAGFSFGAAIAVRAAISTHVDGLISVAPAISRFASGLESQPACPWLVVQGDEDELVDIDEILAWVDGLEPGPELLVVNGAEHFFHGRLTELREAVMDFVDRN
ncbi:MAG: alpha/beta fold hydrolase [Gammaproteobacteria bacterium]|nr:alpha/beta fold hydrolase [Gammaproteobacteria bacterium]NNF49406.1 alpha/beta fold hydrolase [Woeseiaceae bacterium]MBT8093521.1 alpha/beta fold hydrolase [Gammaproteobacteria bacterium]MBT8106515.1 alpha/beta fold hydrolase [Gammaproteobacteria bacterium]NNK26530.1 alpha/beta fold hydrolase [Woeseiaceae bacterium]